MIQASMKLLRAGSKVSAIAALALCLTFIGNPLAQYAPKSEMPGWTVARVEGQVSFTKPATSQPISLTRGTDTLPPTTEVTTGADGTVVLTDQHDVIVVRPNSSITLPAYQGQGFVAVVIQRLGSAFYKVETRRNGGFRVETPYLVAAVKGTGFTVSVAANQASVSVSEGKVGVTQNATSTSVDVTPGLTASVSATAGSQMSVGPTPSAPANSAPTAAPASRSAAVTGAPASNSAASSRGSATASANAAGAANGSGDGASGNGNGGGNGAGGNGDGGNGGDGNGAGGNGNGGGNGGGSGR